MAIRKSVTNPQTGQTLVGTVVDVVNASEPMISLELKDGTVIRIKASVSEVVLFDQRDSKGNPSYHFDLQITSHVYPPEDMAE